MIEIYRKGYYGCDEFIREFNCSKDVINFIGQEADRLNYGIYRTWTDDGRVYFDCGPITYYADDLED